jgi:nucleoid DNA-binding protein
MEEVVNKSDLMDLVGERNNFTKSESIKAVNAVFDILQETIKNGDKVQIRDFGTFEPTIQKAYTARNPKTGEAVDVPEKNSLRFKASKNLKNFLNGVAKEENSEDDEE